jgi:photosystem I subunit II
MYRLHINNYQTYFMAETLNLQIPSPTFEGSTGGWLRAAEVEEKYAITWTSPK